MAPLMLFAIALAGVALQATVLGRCAWKGIWKTYPFFSFQVFCSLLATLALAAALRLDGAHYEKWYWIAECSTTFVGCGNILEILRHGFAQSPRTTVFTRTMRILLGLSCTAFAPIYLYPSRAWEGYDRFVLIQRDFRLVQAALLLTIVGALFYFGIRLNRNIRGIFVGYGILISSNLMTLALQSHFAPAFDLLSDFLLPLCYVLSLVVYLFAIWNYSPPVAPRFVFEEGISGQGLVVSRLQWLRLALSRRGAPLSRSSPVPVGSLKQGR